MLIIALVLAAIGLAALVFAVVTSNALVAWVCIGASLLGVLLLIVDALRERRRSGAGPADDLPAVGGHSDSDDAADTDGVADTVDGAAETSEAAEVGESAVAADYDAESAEETAEEPAAHPAD
ncbi:MAG: hypothetical protein ABI253_14700 [Mycobacterium sp.]